MIDLTPLDVRKKRDDFRKILRGYDPDDVDTFLELVSERMEELVKENLTLRERTDRLQEQVSSQLGRERAVQEALVTAQELRDDIRGQARQEADEVLARAEREAALVRKEAEARAEQILARAHRQLEERGEALKELERQRLRFLRSFRTLLERELDIVEVEEGRAPLEETAVELDFGGGRPVGERTGVERPVAERPASSARAPSEPPAGEGPSGGAESRAAGPEESAATDESAAPEESAAPVGKAGPAAPSTAPEGGAGAPPASESLQVEGPGATGEDLPSPHELPSAADDLPSPEETEEDDPKRWLSSLVERELNEKGDEESWS